MSQSGLETDVKNVETDGDITAYDAVVLGSAVYRGIWLKSARDFAERHAEELASRPTWLFSSGPIGSPPRPANYEQDPVAGIMPKVKPREHHIFAGKLDKSNLNLREKAIVRMVHGAEGDFRDWGDIFSWARGIAETLRKETKLKTADSLR